MQEILASMPKEQEHRFESAGEFIRRLAHRVAKWREGVAKDEVPVVLTFLPTGDVVEVLTIGEDGHSSVVIEGLVDGAPACLFLIRRVCRSFVIRGKFPMMNKKRSSALLDFMLEVRL
ncbi:hypothetical protein ACFSW8_11315 [Rubritalea tangerina]|uniref:SCP2 domain-containing protein n=2 Tax=Rubritalea tangerina TaxID=430798 RepID=A0ABW4ZCQ8_9BACT